MFILKKSSTFANLLIEKPGIDLLHFCMAWKIDKQLSGLNSFSLNNNKNYSLKKSGVFPLK